MSEEIKPLSSSTPSYTVGSPPDEDRREKDKKPVQNEKKPTDESEQAKHDDEDNEGLFDEFV